MYIKKLLFVSTISLCTANIVFANNTPQSDITHDVIGYEQSAYGQTKGYVATKSATGSKMDIDITEIPQSVSVVTKDMMEARDVQSIQNVTAYNASVFQPYGENSDVRTNYGKLRGMDSLYRSSFLNGMKLLYAGHNIPKIDPYALERVDILKGPSSVLYGSSGAGGLLNLQSKKPNESLSKEVGLSVGSDKRRSIFTDLNSKINDKLLFRFTGKYKEQDSELDRSDSDSFFINPALTYLINDHSSLDIYTSFAHEELRGLGMTFNGAKTILNYPTSIINAGGASINPTLPAQAAELDSANLPSTMLIGLPNDEVFEKNHQFIEAAYTNQLNEETKFKSSFRAMDMDGKIHYSLPDATKLANLYVDLSVLPMTFTETEADTKTFVMDNSIEYKWQNKDIENTLVAGFDAQYTNYETTTTSPVQYNFDLLNPNYSQKIIKSNTLVTDTRTKSWQLGLYAQNHMKIYDKFIVSAALRFDKLNKETTNNLTNTTSEQKDDNLAGRLGFIYQFDNGFSPYIAYSTSFEPNIGSDKNGNSFTPSVGKQIEIGTKFKPENMNAIFSLAAFKLEKEDLVVSDPTDSNFNVQQGDAEVKGIEFDATINPIEHANMVFSFAKFSGKEVNMADKEYEGRDLSDLPEYTLGIWTDYTFKNTAIGDLKVGAGVKYIGKSKILSTDYLGTGKQKLFDVDAYTITDALISTQYKNATIALNVNNLFDRTARLRTDQISSGETAGRSFNISVKYKF